MKYANAYLAQVVLRKCGPYIPFKSGALIESGVAGEDSVSWHTPYAAKQYYKYGENRGGTIRGARWVERMMIDKGKEVAKEVSELFKRDKVLR